MTYKIMVFSFLTESKNPGSVKLKTHIVDVIKNAIIEGRLKPGQHLPQDKIAAAMGASSIPVREAFSILAEELYVTYHPNRGTFVSEIDVEKVREAFEIRYFLESGAFSIALPKMQEQDFAEAERLLNMGEKETNINKKMKFDLGFHMSLCHRCNRPYLLELIKQMHEYTAWLVNLSIYIMKFKQHPVFNHGELLVACKKKDVPGANNILKHHLQCASDLICEKYEV